MSVWRSAWATPLMVVAVLAAILGFLVARHFEPAPASGPSRVSVIALPSTPTPKPTLTPSPTATPGSDGGTGGTGGRGGGSGSCPANCTCESRPPSGIVIRCTN